MIFRAGPGQAQTCPFEVGLPGPDWRLKGSSCNTRVLVGNGTNTAFWNDLWIGDNTLAEAYPALHSHSTRPNASVGSALRLGGKRAC